MSQIAHRNLLSRAYIYEVRKEKAHTERNESERVKIKKKHKLPDTFAVSLDGTKKLFICHPQQ
jgi:uncharacterized protein YktB (UPF0637 family)